MFAEFDRQWQANIAETHDSNPRILDIEHDYFLWLVRRGYRPGNPVLKARDKGQESYRFTMTKPIDPVSPGP
jgi:hypothetical protein